MHSELIGAAVSSAAFICLLIRSRRRNKCEECVDKLTAERVELKAAKKLAASELFRLTKWSCDVRAEGCCIPSMTDWPPKGSGMRHQCKQCNWDCCTNCLPLSQHEHALKAIPVDLVNREQKRKGFLVQRTEANQALKANEAALAMAKHRFELHQTAGRVHGLLKAASRAAASVERGLANDRSDAGDVAPYLRSALLLLCEATMSGREILEAVVDGGVPSSRKGFLRALHELIPFPADHVSGGTGGEWRDEWGVLTAEWAALTDQAHMKKWLRHVSNVDNCIKTHKEQIDACVRGGWPLEHAVALWLLQSRIRALARALRERDACYAHSLYTLTTALVAAAARQREPAPRLYANLTGKFGLVLNDDSWQRLEVPDRYGFRGLSTAALVKAACGPSSFGRAEREGGLSGFAVRVTRTRPETMVMYEVQDSAVVCFESAPPSADSLHSAIMVGEHEGFFP